MTSAKTKPKPCSCIDGVNEALEQKGMKLDQMMQLNMKDGTASMSGPLVSVVWSNEKKRKKTPPVLCSYCPFCGKKR